MTESFIETFDGTKFHFDDIINNTTDINVIAHALSMQCRYAGHCRDFYSVAEHSVHMAAAVYTDTDDANLAFEALMHDATEAYVCDIPRPMKHLLPEYIRMEAEVHELIAKDFGVPAVLTPLVKEYDMRICKDEREQIMSDSGNVWVIDDLEPLGVTIEFWPPDKGSDEFLFAYHMLINLLE